MMSHWSDAYVGRPYVEGEFDCAELARTVNREVFGRAIRLPAERWHAGKAGAARLMAMRAQIEDGKADYGVPTDAPQDGDAVLLYSRARLAHIGLYCLIPQGLPSVVGGAAWVLHAADDARQAVRTRLRELERLGYRLEGYYTWIV